jgi:hypothetical protein
LLFAFLNEGDECSWLIKQEEQNKLISLYIKHLLFFLFLFVIVDEVASLHKSIVLKKKKKKKKKRVEKARVLSIIPTPFSPLFLRGRTTTTESRMMIMDDCEIVEYTPFLLNGIYNTGSRLFV